MSLGIHIGRAPGVPLRDRARGQWRTILASVGIDDLNLKKGASCPLCGGEDRFVFYDTNGDGTWFCRHCGKGSGTDLVMKYRGMDFVSAAKLIEQHIGAEPAAAVQVKPAIDPTPKLKAMWGAATPTAPGDIVDTYLRSRGVSLDVYPSCLRTAASLRYYDDDAASNFPAMLAFVRAEPATIHRTYLAADGSGKAPVEKPRKAVSRHGKSPRIQLAAVAETLGIAEGIETALSAMKLFGVPTWSVISTYGVETFEPPPEVKRLIIFGDNDSNRAGHKAVYSLQARLSIESEARFPDRVGDWNDVLLERLS
jgi:putative DNA primase/helicase